MPASSSQWRWRLFHVSCALVILVLCCMPAAASEGESVLAIVNGESVTSAEIDGLLQESHGNMTTGSLAKLDPRRLLDKAINDRLILQQAYAMGMDEDPELTKALQDDQALYAVELYRSAAFKPEIVIDEARVEEDFQQYYWEIQIRQLTMRNRDELEAARNQVLSGADMDTLTRELSIDVMKNRGGLHNLKYWRDIELEVRPVAIDLQPSEVSEVFEYRGVWSFLRCEKRMPVAEEVRDSVTPGIRQYYRNKALEREWEEFVAGLQAEFPVSENPVVLERIKLDSEEVLNSSFFEGSEDVVLEGSTGVVVTDNALRRAISHATMEDAQRPFEETFEIVLKQEHDKLVLSAAARARGYFEDPRVIARFNRRKRDALIEAYLQEAIVPKITFSQAEFEEFYQENLEEFRGDEEVLLDVVVIADEETARDFEVRLAEGADFDFLKRQFEVGDESSGKARWGPKKMFSAEIEAEIERLEIGEGSKAIEIPTGWMLFQLEGKRPGSPRPLEEVELGIRRVIFQRKFNQYLDEHLALLKERSEIVIEQDAVAAYFGS